MAFQDGENNKYRYNSSYTAEEAEVVDKAKRTHRETTASAQRALKVGRLMLRRCILPPQICLELRMGTLHCSSASRDACKVSFLLKYTLQARCEQTLLHSTGSF